MKICLIGDANSIHIRRWAEWFKDRGHEIQMISLTPMNTPIEIYDKYVYIAKRTGPFGYFRTIFPVRNMIRRWKPDIVNGHYISSAGFYTSMSGAKAKVVSAWGSDVYWDTKKRLQAVTTRYAINHANVCFANSNHLIDTIKGMCPKADVRKVIFGVDTELFKPKPIKHDKFRFLSIRQTAKLYNQLTIVQAFESADLDAELWIFKPTADSFDVMDYVKSRPALEKKVVWLDNRPYDEMPELFNSVDVGISIPSTDTSSTAMLECMACGVPVIVGAIPQVREWIEPKYLWNWDFKWHGENGWLVNIKGLDHLTNTMSAVMGNDHNHLDRLGENARKKVVESADWNTEMLKAEKMFQEVVNAN
jgi:glycosyltransferase involved in cell wall biosynthesis